MPDRSTSALRVGAARTIITPPPGLPMAGYAARAGVAAGTMDELHCRIVVFADARSTLVLVVCDVLFATCALTRRVRERVAAVLDVPAGNVMLCATHTHCGPGGLADETGAEFGESLAEHAGEAARAASAAAEPARLILAHRRVPGVNANRRTAAGPADDDAVVLAAYPVADRGEPIVTIVNFACHPTVLGPDTLEYSADFPGAVCAVLESICGGLGVYLQGGAGDVSPVHAGQNQAECRRIGRMLGATAAAAALDGLGRLRGLCTISPSWSETLDADARSEAVVVAPDAISADQRCVEAATARPDADTSPLVATSAREQAALASMRWVRGLRAEGNLFGSFDVPSAEHDTLVVQHFHLGTGLDLVALPGEPFEATVGALRARHGDALLVAGYANQSAGYLPPAAEFARLGYEVGCCQYEPGVAEAVAAAAADLLAKRAARG